MGADYLVDTMYLLTFVKMLNYNSYNDVRRN